LEIIVVTMNSADSLLIRHLPLELEQSTSSASGQESWIDEPRMNAEKKEISPRPITQMNGKRMDRPRLLILGALWVPIVVRVESSLPGTQGLAALQCHLVKTRSLQT
jgi:hypothetical protein